MTTFSRTTLRIPFGRIEFDGLFMLLAGVVVPNVFLLNVTLMNVLAPNLQLHTLRTTEH
jgi:hypothetical protein